MLAIARALLTNPRLLLLDEPFEGLAPVVVDELVAAMRGLFTDGGMALVIVEQHMELACEFAPRILVMDRGRIAYDGPSERLKNEPALLNRLLGVGGEGAT